MKSKDKREMKKLKKEIKGCNISCSSGGGTIYGLGLIGSVIYFISTSTGFWNGVLGIFKALVWPAILVFELLKYLAA